MAVEDSSARRLVEIAALLGCPVDSFYAPGEDAFGVGMTCELLSLWSTIRHPEVRQRILEVLRHETERDVVAPEAAE
ncbi:hypothetical protein MKK63_23020 [Methylobacterium sp. J-088]|uniref:hypothetical protein n=1 Tax=unclassified Methylobacterium TaxID=2615210 RepID=UPI001FBB0ECD|nr:MULTISPECIES: hypothetical protein [unclassified Methylobacterium]MCJ2065558.1 hypothetical protein [Methylobacterium sp. J-088]